MRVTLNLKRNSLYISFYFLLNIFLVYLFSIIGFIFSIKINIFYMILSLAVSTVVLYVLNFKSESKNVKFCIQLGVSFFLFAIGYVIASTYWDFSFDGRVYHQMGVYLLKNGWNPLFEVPSKGFISANIVNEDILNLCICHPKFLETTCANFYLLFNNMESAKILNYIILFAAFGYSFYTQKNFNFITTFEAFLVAVILVLNPVVLSQISTFYVDLHIYMFFLIILCSIINLERKNQDDKKINVVIFLISSVMFLNVKMNAILYFTIISICYFIYLLFKERKQLKRFLVLISIIVALWAVTGINPYYTNIKSQKFIFYPMNSEYEVASIIHSTPKSIVNKNGVEKFLISIFSSSSNNIDNAKAHLKIPFSISGDSVFDSADFRVGGFGYFFSGVLLLSLVLLFGLRFQNKKNKEIFFLIFSIIIISVILHPENWWARYIPQLWCVPAFIAMVSLCERNIFPKCIIYLCLIIMFVNSFIILKQHLSTSKSYTYLLSNSLSAISHQNKKLTILNKDIQNFYEYSFFIKLKDYNIDYNYVEDKNNSNYMKKYTPIPMSIDGVLFWDCVSRDEKK